MAVVQTLLHDMPCFVYDLSYCDFTDFSPLRGPVRAAHAMGDANVCMWQCFTHVSSRLSIMLIRQHRSRISYYI